MKNSSDYISIMFRGQGYTIPITSLDISQTNFPDNCREFEFRCQSNSAPILIKMYDDVDDAIRRQMQMKEDARIDDNFETSESEYTDDTSGISWMNDSDLNLDDDDVKWDDLRYRNGICW